jgi:hypothetical protein
MPQIRRIGAVRQCTIGTFPLFDALMDSRGCAFPSSPITVSARTCQRLASPHLGRGSLGHGNVDVVKTTYGLYGVAANGLIMYVCCTCLTVVELWAEVGQ